MRAKLFTDNVLVEFSVDQSDLPENCRRARVIAIGPFLEDMLTPGAYVLVARAAWPVNEVGDRIILKMPDILARIEPDDQEANE